MKVIEPVKQDLWHHTDITLWGIRNENQWSKLTIIKWPDSPFFGPAYLVLDKEGDVLKPIVTT